MNSLLVNGIVDVGKDLIARFFPNPEDRAKAELELMKMQQSGELTELAARMDAIKTEAASSDPWTSRARPMFMYVFYLVIIMLVMITPIIGVFFPAQMEIFFKNVDMGFKAIPSELWLTFSAGYLGYSGLRTIEKNKGVTK